MEELILDCFELKRIIDESILVGSGYYSAVFTYQDRLIKLEKKLYHFLKGCEKAKSREIVEKFYSQKEDDFNSIEQLNYLFSIQKNVLRTDFPQGVVILKDFHKMPGIIIPYYKGYRNLEFLKTDNKEKVLRIMQNILYSIKELENNHIAQEDLYRYYLTRDNKKSYNIMYKDDDVKLIDVSGDYLICHAESYDIKLMYIDLGNVLLDFFEYYHIPFPIQRFMTSFYDENEYLVHEFQKELKKR